MLICPVRSIGANGTDGRLQGIDDGWILVRLESLSRDLAFFVREKRMVLRMIMNKGFDSKVKAPTFPKGRVSLRNRFGVQQDFGRFQPAMLRKHLKEMSRVVARLRLGAAINVHHRFIKMLFHCRRVISNASRSENLLYSSKSACLRTGQAVS